MTFARRRVAALVAAMTILAAFSGTANAAELVSDGEFDGALRQRSEQATAKAPRPCQDAAFRLISPGVKWNETYEWAFRASSTPARLTKASVAGVLQKSFDNITGAHNDCGLPDRVSAQHRYLGTTDVRPDCKHRDGHNVIGFGRLQFGVLAVTCFWMRNGKMVEADIKINSRESWALSLNGCHESVALEATMTHEAGHVFGLGHVGERRHGRLTMSPFLNGPCENSEATLGLGDVRGLEALY